VAPAQNDWVAGICSMSSDASNLVVPYQQQKQGFTPWSMVSKEEVGGGWVAGIISPELLCPDNAKNTRKMITIFVHIFHHQSRE
jgi:hypothetical protein